MHYTNCRRGAPCGYPERSLWSVGAKRLSILSSSLLGGWLILLLAGCGAVTTATTIPTSTSVPPTQTSCPAAGTARAAVMTPLALGNHQTIVYTVNTGPFDPFGGASLGELKRYEVNIGFKNEIVKIANKGIPHAEISPDGQWVLFVTRSRAPSGLVLEAVQMVRMDGGELQTLYCPGEGNTLGSLEWSADQKWVVFSAQFISASLHEPTTVYLLNMVTGQLRTALSPPNNSDTPVVGYTPVTWLDSTRVYLTDITGIGRSQNLYVLDTAQAAAKENTGLQIIAHITKACWDFDRSFDGSSLFLSQCTPNNGPSTITVQPATGGSQQTIFSSRTLAVTAVRMLSKTSLLLLIENRGGDQSQNGLWRINADGSGFKRLTIDTDGSQQLNQTSQYLWSNISRDGSMYALQESSSAGKAYTLVFGLLGGTPINFASTTDGTRLAIVGWTTM